MNKKFILMNYMFFLILVKNNNKLILIQRSYKILKLNIYYLDNSKFSNVKWRFVKWFLLHQKTSIILASDIILRFNLRFNQNCNFFLSEISLKIFLG